MIFCRNKLCISHDGTREVSGAVFMPSEVQDHFVSAFALKEEPDAVFKMESLGVSPAWKLLQYIRCCSLERGPACLQHGEQSWQASRGLWVQLLELETKTVSCHEDMVLCVMSQLKRQILLCSSYWRCLSHGCKSRRRVAKWWSGVIWGLFQDFQGSAGNKTPEHWRHSTANMLWLFNSTWNTLTMHDTVCISFVSVFFFPYACIFKKQNNIT